MTALRVAVGEAINDSGAPVLEAGETAQAGLDHLTEDLDFVDLLTVGGQATHSVIQFRAQAVLPSDGGEQLLTAVEVAGSHLETGALVIVDPVGHRVTVLPIGMGGA